MPDNLPRWAVYNLESAVAVAPLGFRHDLESRECWCNPKIEQATGDHSRPLIVHQLRVHRGVFNNVCEVCYENQTPANADSFCDGDMYAETTRE